MATRVKIQSSCTPIIDATALADYPAGHPVVDYNFDADYIDKNVVARLGGSTEVTWAGNAVADWASGVHTHKNANGDTITPGAGCDMVWIKNTGYKYDGAKSGNIDRATPTTSTVSLTIGGTLIAVLPAGMGISLPGLVSVITLSSSGVEHAAVEYGIFT